MERATQKLVVVPAYNEEGALPGVLRAIRERAPSWDVLVIDDGSTDRTSRAAREGGAAVVRHPFNLGIGGAVQTGFIYARDHGYALMAQVDGDGQHDPAELAKLEEVMQRERVDVVCGSRFLHPETTYRAPVSRRTGIHIFAFVLSRIVGQRITDPTSGFRIFNRRAIVLFAFDYPHDYPEVEAVLMLFRGRLRMAETPVRMQHRRAGRSSITAGRSLYYMIKVSLALLLGLLRRRPVVAPGEAAPVSATRAL